MNFLKKKLKPLTSGFSANSTSNNKQDRTDKDLEDDLYDEYVVEAPPHPSELLALGVDPTDIDVNDPEKLKELYKKAKEEGKDKKTNSVLLAKQRQKEEIEEKRKTREEWKFFDSITARVEQVVKDSQKTLKHLKESSAIDKLTEPEYELRLSPDQVFKSSATVKQEKSENNWIDFGEEDRLKSEEESVKTIGESTNNLDEFACSTNKSLADEQAAIEAQQFVVEELLEDFGIDLRPFDQKKEATKKECQKLITSKTGPQPSSSPPKLNIDLKAAARPRPRPNATETRNSNPREENKKDENDPFDTSFIAPVEADLFDSPEQVLTNNEPVSGNQPKVFDPFDTSYVQL